MLMTPVVQRLLLANVVVFLLTRVYPTALQDFGFGPGGILVRPWTLVSYMFLHANFPHILFNMLILFFFGPRLEERLGSKSFIWFYVVCGIGGAILSLAFFMFAPFSVIIGASGAVYGVVLGFARYWPREDIYIWGLLPVQARILALFMLLSSLFAGFTGAGDGIAHFAHLGGLVVGWLFLKRWENRRTRGVVQPPGPPPKATGAQDVEAVERWRAIPRERLHEINRAELDALLQKIGEVGVKALTRDERAFLDRIAKSL